MYKWRVEYWLESGAHLVGMYIGRESNSGDVVNKLVAGNPNEFFGLYGENDKHNLLVKKGAIVACDISEWRDCVHV